MKFKQLELQKTIDITAYFFILISVFFLPVSTSINALFIVAAFLALFGLKFQQNLSELKKLRVIHWTLALLLILFIGIFYSSAPLPQAFHAFKKYGLKLFSFMTLAPLFCQPKSRTYIFYSLICGAFTFSFFDVLDHYNLISIQILFHTSKHYFLSAIPFSIYCAFAGLLTLFFSQTETKVQYKWLWYVLLGYFCFYLYFINIQRTGMIVFIVMFFAFACRKLNLKQKIMMLLPALCLLLTLGVMSPVVRSVIENGVNDIKTYNQGDFHTSLGLRSQFLLYSFKLIKDKPVLGYGSGSFSIEYAKIGGPNISVHDDSLGDPHNSYIHLWLQFGIIGLIAFVGWLVSHWLLSKRLMPNERILLQCFLLAFMLSCFSVSAFYRSRISTLYITMAVVCMGNFFQQKKKQA